MVSAVYATPSYISTLDTSTPISDHVAVDFELQGCPINKRQLLEVIGAFLGDRTPNVPAHSVCMECKRRGNVCVMVAHGTPCLGPVTHAGCGALCPVLRSRLLRLLRADGDAERPVAHLLARAQPRGRRGGAPARLPDVQRERSRVPARRARGWPPRACTVPSTGRGAVPENGERTIRTKALARVEGEGAMFVRLPGDEVLDARLEIYEPPRLFEALLRGRAFAEAPDITARICGICPVAYQMSACRAMEDALGVDVPAPIDELRRLIYCGEWLESHALHVHMLHAPDFLGYESAWRWRATIPRRSSAGCGSRRSGTG